LVKDGKAIAAIQEERLNNIKHFAGIPEKSILEVFRIAGLNPSWTNLISLVSFHPVSTLRHHKEEYRLKCIKVIFVWFHLSSCFIIVNITSFRENGF